MVGLTLYRSDMVNFLFHRPMHAPTPASEVPALSAPHWCPHSMLDHVLHGIGALLFDGGAKSSPRYGRLLMAGNAGSFTEFRHERYAASASEAGTYVSGQVGQVATGLTDATIFLIWDGFLVVQETKS